MRAISPIRLLTTVSSLALAACSAAGPPPSGASAAFSSGGAPSSAGGLSSNPLAIGGETEQGGAMSGTAPVEILTTLPEGFSNAGTDADHPGTSRGGYKVLGPLADVPPP